MTTIIACVDPRMGLSFNQKRQSRDKNVIHDILTVTEHNNIIINPYSVEYVLTNRNDTSDNHRWIITKNPLETLENPDFIHSDYVFVEINTLPEIAALLNKADRVILYVWNETYMYTEQFPDIRKQTQWTKISSHSFPGSSHDEITCEIYERTTSM